MPDLGECDARPLDDFRGDAPGLLAGLKATGRPLVLTVGGKAEFVVQDAESYGKLLALAERLETIEAVREGLASVDRGEGRPSSEAFDDLERELRPQPGR